MIGDNLMQNRTGLTRREFIHSAAALSFIYLPGIGRVKASPIELKNTKDFSGRLCYNENPLGPSPMALTAMQEAASISNRYPDWYSSNLESQIAAHHGLQQNNICAGTGATEVIRLIADAFLLPGDEMITATPTYFQMATEALANGANVVHVPVDENYVIDLQAISQTISSQTKLISLVNPNNPLATIINKDDMETFLNSIPAGIVIVVDEAYHHYVNSPNYESCIRFIGEGLPVIIVRTFSKAYGLAGARIGYSVASSSYTSHISSSQMFGTVSNLSQAAAQAALSDTEHLRKSINSNNEAKNFLETGFTNLELNFIASETNFMMFDTGTSAVSVASQLASRGYQVRSGWGMPQYIRISTGLMDEMNGFMNALEDILGKGGNDAGEIPYSFAINSIYPNPFNSQCKIKITADGVEKVNLSIYDMLGRKVRTLLHKSVSPGIHQISWDGRDLKGRTVASGVYIFNLIQGEFAASARATLVK
jgi:histidinol-phosphate aminotransferase